jgi:quercetin dioxygenase-like cupin family protein
MGFIDVADTNSWQVTASRAAHPSQRVAPLLGPGDLLLEIAAGIGVVTVPAELLSRPATRLGRELVLTTPAYDVWVMSWPAGEAADLHTHDRFVAFHVVSGELMEERQLVDGRVRSTRRTGSTTLVPPNTPHRLVSNTAATTVHVHAKDLA